MSSLSMDFVGCLEITRVVSFGHLAVSETGIELVKDASLLIVVGTAAMTASGAKLEVVNDTALLVVEGTGISV